ncbi:MAG: molybdate ABC transporter substrate-binding protein [Pseudomonadota bacterium]
MTRVWTYLKAGALAVGFAGPAAAADAVVAVAANFLTTARALEATFEADTGYDLTLAHGSTGRLYAQIINGAPFDLFLAADAARPEALKVGGAAVAQRTYAVGQLVLVARGAEAYRPADLVRGQRVAMANPELAPYGAAAFEALEALGVMNKDFDPVLGDSVGQAATFLATGNADLAFLAASQLDMLDPGLTAFAMAGLHAPVRQDAVLLARGDDNPAARAFFDWLGGPEARAIIETSGYSVPE